MCSFVHACVYMYVQVVEWQRGKFHIKFFLNPSQLSFSAAAAVGWLTSNKPENTKV
jgi:hypothetical protein